MLEADEATSRTIPEEPSDLDLVMRSAGGYAKAVQWLAPYAPLYVTTELASLGGEGWDPKGELAAEWSRTHREGADGLSQLIEELNGFYVKAGQLIATRVDLFPREYSSRLSHLVDSLNPLPFELVRTVVEQELLGGYPLEEVFESFEEQPLGSASIAQVHRARLRGGREVAVKVQRPQIEPQLMSDIAVIKNVSAQLRNVFPVDYYVVFSELEEQLREEFDFHREAASMDSVAALLRKGGRQPPVFVPQSVPGLVTRRVLCMDFVPGVPLSQLEAELKRQGISTSPDSRLAQEFGRRLLQSLSEAFGAMIFEGGFFHADPHPGNVFVTPDGTVALIDYGQMKRIGYKFRRELAEMVVLICECQDTPEQYSVMAKLGERMGLEFAPDAHPFCPAALGLWILDWSRTELPGGYDIHELSTTNVMSDVTYFPREWVLTCRALQLIRGLAARLNIPWTLPQIWRENALRVLSSEAATADIAEGPRAGDQVSGSQPRWRPLQQARRWWEGRLQRHLIGQRLRQ